MKKTILLFLALLLLLPQHIKADYAVISGDGTFIEGSNEHQAQSVASISKIMTALVVIKHSDLNEMVTISKEAATQIGSSIYLKPNQQVSILTLLYGLMLRSGNDAAYALAEHIGGNVENFVAMMNEEAKQLGMNDTLFRNPSGLDEFDGGNISTCYDMALCMQAAMNYDAFKEIVSAKTYHGELGVFKNKNRLLNEYDACTGGKTGYTTHSGKTLVTSAEKGGMESIVVSFKESEYFTFHQQKHEAFFENFDQYVLLDKGEYTTAGMTFKVEEPFTFLYDKTHEEPFQIETNIEGKTLTLTVTRGTLSKSAVYPLQKRSWLGRWFHE